MPEVTEELKLTYTDILSLGESNRPMELYDGEFVMAALPIPLHQFISANIIALLRGYVHKRKTGKVFTSVDVYLSEVTVLQPDVCYLSNERSWINDGKKFKGAPDLVVEIISPSTEERDRTFKFREYAKHGAKEYWIVSPHKQEIEVYQNSERGFQLVRIFKPEEKMNTPLFPDAEFEVEEVFV
ncbi:MAG: Uma2 family endonuclease [Ignavibacteriales bacterium]|nr:Uma2 family endonuclease [Ignavibacteriales bacterium]